jgi:membrane associated rhomboid family serine protease
MIDYLFYFNTFTNVMAVAFVFIGAAMPHIMKEDPVIKVGAFLACFGLMGQALRNIQFLMTGISPPDSELPLWMLKDLGLVIMIFGYAMRGSIPNKLKGKQ